MFESFKVFLESEIEDNVKKMISKLPKGHQKLLKGYKFTYAPGVTLAGDNEHIGYIHKNKIVVASPWNYGREFTTLHEIGHLVYEYKMTPELKKEWANILSKTKENQKKNQTLACQKSLDQNDEEIFAMAYATTYTKHPLKTYLNTKWQEFIKSLPD